MNLNQDAWLNADFWANILRGTANWALHAVPKILLIVLLAIVLLKILRFGCARMVNLAGRTRPEEDSHPDREHQKRMETLVGIARKAGQVTIWTFVLMLVLV